MTACNRTSVTTGAAVVGASILVATALTPQGAGVDTDAVQPAAVVAPVSSSPTPPPGSANAHGDSASAARLALLGLLAPAANSPRGQHAGAGAAVAATSDLRAASASARSDSARHAVLVRANLVGPSAAVTPAAVTLHSDAGVTAAPTSATGTTNEATSVAPAIVGPAAASPAALVASTAAATAPSTGSFFANFIGPAGSPPNPQIWGYDLGGGGWGNNEQEVYTNSPNNVRLDGNGDLVIQAQSTPTGYTSARLVTRGKADVEYGTLMARIKFPSGQGIWPAFWMLGSNINSVGWPAAGEIDMMELPDVGTTYNTALHGPWANGQPGDWTASNSGPAGTDLSKGFHNYWVTREPGLIMIGVDGYVRGVYTKSSLPAGAQWVFDAPSYVILNVAVGGNWPGPPNNSTPFPATMLVNWVSYTATPVAGTTSAVKTASTLSAAAPAQRSGPTGATAIAAATATPTVAGAPVAAAGGRHTDPVSTTLPSSAPSGNAPTAKPSAASGTAPTAKPTAASGAAPTAKPTAASVSGIGPSGAAGSSAAGVPAASGSAAAASGTAKPGPGVHVPTG